MMTDDVDLLDRLSKRPRPTDDDDDEEDAIAMEKSSHGGAPVVIS